MTIVTDCVGKGFKGVARGLAQMFLTDIDNDRWTVGRFSAAHAANHLITKICLHCYRFTLAKNSREPETTDQCSVGPGRYVAAVRLWTVCFRGPACIPSGICGGPGKPNCVPVIGTPYCGPVVPEI